MKLYLVRHGKSVAHESNKRQSPDTPLGFEGKKQALSLASRISSEPIEIILSSPWARALETAQSVSSHVSLPIEQIEMIHEREHHPAIYGIDYADTFNEVYETESKANEHNFDWKFEGKGESMKELIARAKKFQKYLETTHSNKNVLAVTHEHFVRAFITTVLLGDTVSDETFKSVFQKISLKNTGISLFEFDAKTDAWKLVYLNDHMHTL